MDRSQLVVLADAMAALAFAAIAASILVPLSRSGRLRDNRLDLAAAMVFAASSIGNVIQLVWVVTRDSSNQGESWQMAAWDALTALIAVSYLWLRRANADPEEGGGLYEDARRRQHELAGQVMAANVREELATERAAAAEQRLNRVFTSAAVGLAVIDRRGTISRANPALAGLLEGPADHPSLVGVALSETVAPADRTAVEELVATPTEGTGIELHIRRHGGDHVVGRLSITPLPDDDGSLLAQLEDLTDRRRVEDKLEHLMLHDPLTDLPNRVLFHTRATAALRQANRTGCYVGCLIIDLDGFKVVNDSLGHTAGDLLLNTMARRLTTAVRPGDTVARTGSDEFCLLLVGLEHQAEAEVVSQRVRDALDLTVDLDGVQVATSGSVGVAVALPGDRATSETLVRDADIALCRAKAQGRGHTVVFDAELREDVLRRLELVTQPVTTTS